jgi:hypothetical protein
VNPAKAGFCAFVAANAQRFAGDRWPAMACVYRMLGRLILAGGQIASRLHLQLHNPAKNTGAVSPTCVGLLEDYGYLV